MRSPPPFPPSLRPPLRDKLACAYVQRLHLHAVFHLCTAVAPLLFLTHAVHCFYSSELAARTGRIADATGRLVPAPPEVRAYIAARDAREAAPPPPPPGAPVAVPQLFWLPPLPVPFVALQLVVVAADDSSPKAAPPSPARKPVFDAKKGGFSKSA